MEVLSFLSEPRRQALMQRLSACDMPVATARRITLIPHDLRKLDQLLAELVSRLAKHCDAVHEATRYGNRERQRSASAQLQADLAVFNIFTQEIVERRLPASLFPRTTALIGSREITDDRG